VFVTCGFGFSDFTWDSPFAGKNEEITVQEALKTVTDENVFIIAAPKWAWNLPLKRYVQIVCKPFEELNPPV
jgi:hypothetical protein